MRSARSRHRAGCFLGTGMLLALDNHRVLGQTRSGSVGAGLTTLGTREGADVSVVGAVSMVSIDDFAGLGQVAFGFQGGTARRRSSKLHSWIRCHP